MLRLDREEKRALEKAISGIRGEVYLFGSRLDSDAKGGDIDILIFSDSDAYHLSKGVSTTFFNHCEEKVDVVVINPKKITPEQKTFVNMLKVKRLK